MENNILFHYFFNTSKPMSSILDVEAGDIEGYERLANEIGMIGYNSFYFEKRNRIENQCREHLLSHEITPERKRPIYMVLGRHDDLYFIGRHHKYSMAIPIEELNPAQMIFIAGDSMNEEKPLRDRMFVYDDFKAMSDERIHSLLPQNEMDQYVEVQIWQADVSGFIEKECDKVKYILKANFPDVIDVRKLASEIECLKKKEVFKIFTKNLWEGNDTVIPCGMMHGVPHSVRCSFLAFLIATEYGFDVKDAIWIAKCAAYHDCGRLAEHNKNKFAGGELTYHNTDNEERHAEQVKVYLNLLFSDEDRIFAYDVMRCHNKSQSQIEQAFQAYPDEQKKYQIAACIVHDADTLDYIRLSSECGIACFSPQYLILDLSQEYISVALELFIYSSCKKNWIQLLFGES